MSARAIIERALEQGKGILRLSPTWVPRSFCVPGRRIKLHPADYYAFGGERGGIDERWFSSTTPADNGPKTSRDEGLSFVVAEDGSGMEKENKTCRIWAITVPVDAKRALKEIKLPDNAKIHIFAISVGR